MQSPNWVGPDSVHPTLEAPKRARAKAHAAWRRSPWEQRHEDNSAVLAGGDESDATPDGCAVCGAAKADCMRPAEHFGPRGESPPDTKCAFCPANFRNFYNSQHALQLHVAAQHAARAAGATRALLARRARC